MRKKWRRKSIAVLLFLILFVAEVMTNVCRCSYGVGLMTNAPVSLASESEEIWIAYFVNEEDAKSGVYTSTMECKFNSSYILPCMFGTWYTNVIREGTYVESEIRLGEKCFAGWKCNSGRRVYPGMVASSYLKEEAVYDILPGRDKKCLVVKLVAVWNMYPKIWVKPIAFSMKEALDGKIKEERLKNAVMATDEEGQVEIYFPEFEKEEFMELSGPAKITIRACARDSDRNIATAMMPIIVGEWGMMNFKKRLRFASKRYILTEDGNFRKEEEGGLMEESWWRTKEGYQFLMMNLTN